MKTWTHPGGKLIEIGPSALSDEELIAILLKVTDTFSNTILALLPNPQQSV